MKALEPETIELIEQYAKGQVTDKEAQFVRDLLQSDPKCREYHDFLLHFNHTLDQAPAEPPIWLKRKIMNQINEPNPFQFLIKWAPVAAAAAFLLVAGMMIGSHLDQIAVALSHVLPAGANIGSLGK
jgi:anti-sigma factor RsiW